MVRKFPPFCSERKKRSTSEGTPQFPNGISGKLPYHLTSNRNFRIFWPNGKHPWTLFPECFVFELYYRFFSITWPFICYGFHRSRVANRSDISRKKAYLSPLLRSWSTGKCSVRTIFLSSSEIGSWPQQFPRENCRAKDVRVFVAQESDRCSEGSPISSPFGSDKQLWYQGKLLGVSFLGFWFGIWL